MSLKTAVCISGALSHIENYENHFKHIIEPYKADVFIDSWIPYAKHSMKVGLRAQMSDDEKRVTTVFPEEVVADINAYAEAYRPKLINLEFFDAMPLTHQVRSTLPPSAKTYNGRESAGTKKENVMFMYYKIWKVNELRKLYERINKIRYDIVIRLRFDTTFESFPVIEPARKVIYVPDRGDYEGGLNDQCALGDAQAMDIYCELYNEIYRYSVAGIGCHPESLLRKHLEINRMTIERFECGMTLRGRRL